MENLLRRGIRLTLALIALGWMPTLGAQGAAVPLTLAVHPYLPATELQDRLQPLADYLAREMERKVIVRVGKDYKEHLQAVGADQVDLALMGPVSYVLMRSRFGEKPLLARLGAGGQPMMHGVIAVRRDSPLQDLASLIDKRFAFGAPESTTSHAVPRYMLLRAGIPRGLPTEHRFLGSHRNVAMGVLVGDFDAGALQKEVFDEFAPRGLRALAVTPGVPESLFVARSDLPPAEVQRLRRALLNLARLPHGPAILARLRQDLTALAPVADTDYDPLRAMMRAVDIGGN